MLLTISYASSPALDLGYLLHKNPARLQTFVLPFGQAHVFYPEANNQLCTAALLLDVDPVGLARGRPNVGAESQSNRYVNDRPYTSSSLMSVAIARVFGSAMAGKSRERQVLADSPLPLQAKVSVVPCADGEVLLRRLFEPLGYRVQAQAVPLDETFPEWGASSYFTLELSAEVRLADLLKHLYVLIPVLDDDKHYWVGDAEIEKLLRRGAGWLAAHPERELIAHRYLKYHSDLVIESLSRLAARDNPLTDKDAHQQSNLEAPGEDLLNLRALRLQAVVSILKKTSAKRVLDLGCGEGDLLQLLVIDQSFTEIVGFDVSYRALETARENLRLERFAPAQRDRLKLVHGSLMYRDKRLLGYDAAVVMEVIEHLDPIQLATFERVVFDFARPSTVIVTTPNSAYNVLFPSLAPGQKRHPDHRFEWNPREFQSWASAVAERHHYAVGFFPIGRVDHELGSPSQMAVFTERGVG
jgi:3' terminal RNA ribose 2'-O-methyltransferase Hen1